MTPMLTILTVAVLAIAAYGLFYSMRETFMGVKVANAFSNMQCIKDGLPLVSFVSDNVQPSSSTLQCLSLDGNSCLDRFQLNIPAAIPCANDSRNVNTFLSTDAVRNVRINPTVATSKVFNAFERIPNVQPNDSDFPTVSKMKYFVCTPKGLQNKDHWCGGLWNEVKGHCQSNRFSRYKNHCENISRFIETGPASDDDVEEIGFSKIASLQKVAKEETQSTRNRAR